MSIRNPEPGERRTIAIGATIAIVALIGAFVVMPTVRRWSEREEGIRLSRERVGRLRGLAERQRAIVAAAARRDAAMDAMPRRLLRGRTAALAASELQRVLQEHARMSRVAISRLDVAIDDRTNDTPVAERGTVPATVTAVTDIYGLADLLARLQHGSLLLEVTEIGVTSNAVLRGELLQLSLVVRAPYVLAP